MKHKFIKNVSFQDIWTCLGPGEKSLCCTRNSGESGWESFIAWNPVAQYTGADVEIWKKFVAQQQKYGRRVFGYLSFDLGYSLQKIKPHARNVMQLPDIYFLAFDGYVRVRRYGLEACANNIADLESYGDEIGKILGREKSFKGAESKNKGEELRPIISYGQYAKSFEKIRRYIVDGHIYQINLTHALKGVAAKSARELFLEIYEKNGADFSAYVEGNGFEILSASPERFIKISKDRSIETFPIKGTRPRGETQLEDAKLKLELEKSEKESAELFMITDLLRNDVGKICEFGSVSVESPRVMQRLPAVWHSFSHIKGQLKKNIRSTDALLSMFPGGSVSGCPKKRALEIIDEVESDLRGVYTGAIGFVDPDDSSDFNIAIRSLIKKGKEVFLQVGGGIVYDSEPESEYQESLDKAKSFLGILP